MENRQEFSIFGAGPPEVEIPTPVKVRLAMIMRSNGCVAICAVDQDGSVVSGGSLITFEPKNGKIFSHSDVRKELGFDLDSAGRIRIF